MASEEIILAAIEVVKSRVEEIKDDISEIKNHLKEGNDKPTRHSSEIAVIQSEERNCLAKRIITPKLVITMFIFSAGGGGGVATLINALLT